MSDFLTLREAANLSGYHQDYLSQLIRAGKLQGRRMGKEWLVAKISLAKYLDSKKKAPISGTELKLSWWRRNTKLVIATVAFLGITLISVTALNFETLLAVVVAGDFTNEPSDTQTLIISSEQAQLSKEVVVTSYAIDEGGDLEVSISTRNNE